jgi:hypothetical protein
MNRILKESQAKLEHPQTMSELVVNFGDPASVQDAIPQAGALIEQAEARVASAKRDAAEALERASDAEVEIQRWRALLLTLEQLDRSTNEPAPAPPDDVEAGNSKYRALWVVTAINGPTDIAEVAEHLTEFSRKTVSWALWKLADEGAIQRVGHGRYAPLDYLPGQPTTNYLKLPPGFPAPSHAQISHAVEEALAKAKRRQQDASPAQQ